MDVLALSSLRNATVAQNTPPLRDIIKATPFNVENLAVRTHAFGLSSREIWAIVQIALTE